MQELKDKVNDTPTNSQDPAPPTPLAKLPLVMTVDEVAAFLRLDRKTVYTSISKGEIPGVVRVGRKIRVSSKAVLEWLSGNGQSRPTKRRLS